MTPILWDTEKDEVEFTDNFIFEVEWIHQDVQRKVEVAPVQISAVQLSCLWYDANYSDVSLCSNK